MANGNKKLGPSNSKSSLSRMAREKENGSALAIERNEPGGTKSPAGSNRLTLEKPVGDYGQRTNSAVRGSTQKMSGIPLAPNTHNAIRSSKHLQILNNEHSYAGINN